jgi:ribosomal protein L18
MSYFSKRALRWATPVALVGALGLAACGTSDSTEAVRVAAPSAVGAGSDQHLTNKSAEIAKASLGAGSDQHLNNKAAEIASKRANRAASDRLTGQAEQIQRAEAARLAAQAERFERSAHLEGQANTYSGIEVGNRVAQMAQAEQYVQQLQDRAVTSSGNRVAQMAQAEQYVQQLQDRAVTSSGNRVAQMAQAEQYVEQLQVRAESISSGNDSYDDDFLPGSHHVPVR